jgi:VWFA-related protein
MGASQTKPNETKMLLPVVVTQADGKPCVDLREADFKVEGKHVLRVESAQLIAPERVSAEDTRTPVFVVYNATDRYDFGTAVTVQASINREVLSMLAEIAKTAEPVTLIVFTPDGLKLIHDFSTPPAVLSVALAAVEQGKDSSDPKVQEEVVRLRLLKSVTPGHLDSTSDAAELGALERMAKILQRSPNRKGLVWLGTGFYLQLGFGTSAVTQYSANEQHAVDTLNAAHISVYPFQSQDQSHEADNSNTFDPLRPTANNTRDSVDTRPGNSAPYLIPPRATGQAGDALRQLAYSTGGVKLNNPPKITLTQAVANLRSDFGPYYMLTVSLENAKKTEWIPLKVKVTREGAKVRAQPMYLAIGTN